MKKILIVDDELAILKALTRVFFDTDYEIITANSGHEALEVLNETVIDLIISDMRMPFMDGFELLTIVKTKYPNTIRTIISGYTEERIVLKTAIHNLVKLYFLKPWSNEKLLRSIDQIFSTEDILTSKKIMNLINNIELPTIQSSHQRILGKIDRDLDINLIVDEIEKDISISSTLLHVVNSAYYGLKTGSIRQAAVYVGMQNLKSLVYSIAIFSTLSNNKKEYDYAELVWQHAFLTNKIINFIYNHVLCRKTPNDASAAGLIHNMGIIVLLKNFFLVCVQCREQSEKNSIPLLDLEKEVFQFTHQEIGGYLANWWELPFSIVEATLYHHDPLNPVIINKELVYCVHIAQYYAWDILKKPLNAKFYPEVLKVLEIKKEELEKKIMLEFGT